MKTKFKIGDKVYLGYISDCSPQNGMWQLVLKIEGGDAWLMFKDGCIFHERDIYRKASGVIDRYRLRRRATAETRKIAKYISLAIHV